MTRHLKGLLLITALACAACASGPPTQSGRALHQATLHQAAHVLPEHPMVFSVYPDRYDSQRAHLEKLLGTQLPLSSQAPWLAQILFGTLGQAPEAPLPPLEGLTPHSPVLLGLFSTGAADSSDLIGYGAVPDLTQAPRFLHARAVLPSQDPQKTLRSFQVWTQTQELDEPSPQGQGLLWEQERMLLLATPRDGALLLDLAINVRDPEEAREHLKQAAALTPAARAPSPAWVHFLEADGAASVYMDMDHLAQLYTTSGMLEAAAALEFATPETRRSLYLYAGALVMGGARVVNDLDRNASDVTLSISGAPDAARLRSTRTLTPAARLAQEQSQQQAGRTWQARAQSPVLELRLQQSLRALIASRGLPSWLPTPSLSALQDTFGEGGSFLLLYASQNEPLMQLISLAPDPAYLPDSASLVIEDLSLNPARGLYLSGAVAMDYPAELPEGVKLVAEAIKAQLEDNIQGIPLHLDFQPGDQHTRVQLGILKPAQEILDLDTARPQADSDLWLSVDVQKLLAPMALMLGPDVQAFQNLGRLTLEDHSGQGSHGASWQLASAQPAQPVLAPKPVLIPSSVAAAPQEPTPGHTCLMSLSSEMASALRVWPQVEPQQLERFHTAVREVLQEELACARADTSTAALANDIEDHWLLMVAKTYQAHWMEPQALQAAQQACAHKQPEACQMARALATPWPQGSLQLAQAALPPSIQPDTQAPRLGLTPEHLYLGQEDLGEPTKASLAGKLPPGEEPYLKQDISQRFAKLDELAEARVQIDQRSTWRQLLALTRALRQEKHRPMLRVHDPKLDGARHLTVLLASDQVATPPPEEIAPELWVDWGDKQLSLRYLQQELGPFALGPEGQLDALAVARAVAPLKDSAGDQWVIHLYSDADPSWGALAQLISALHVPANASPEDLEQLQSQISDPGVPSQQRTFLLLDSREPEASRLQQRPPVQFSTSDQVTVGPALRKEQIQAVLRQHQREIRHCYEKELATNPKLIAKITPRFTIGPQGRVTQVELGQVKQEHAQLARCLKQRILQMQFPKPLGGGVVQINYPFVFHPE